MITTIKRSNLQEYLSEGIFFHNKQIALVTNERKIFSRTVALNNAFSHSILDMIISKSDTDYLMTDPKTPGGLPQADFSDFMDIDLPDEFGSGLLDEECELVLIEGFTLKNVPVKHQYATTGAHYLIITED